MKNLLFTLTAVIVCLFSQCSSFKSEEPESNNNDKSESEKSEQETSAELVELEPIDLMPAALGKFTRLVSTQDDQAQAYFNQGIQLKYAFAVQEAARSFQAARKIDPDCSICWWGEAWALGAYLNGAMSNSNAPLAFEAIHKAQKLSDNATEVEQALIGAMIVRYIEDYDRDNRREQDSLYALSMKNVYEAYSEDPDVATIYAEALFLLEKRRGTRDLNDPNVIRLHKILNGVLDVDIEHPGACHLFIHATESTDQPELGESCADYLGNSIPGASHINHMPSHTWNEVGRWGESVRANLQAVQSDQKAAIGEGVAIYPTHNLHMLLYAASFDGQGAIAMQAGKDFANRTGNTMFQVVTLLRFGRFEEILEVENRPSTDIPAGYWDFAQGYARLRNGESDFARVYLNRVLAVADSSEATYRGHPAAHILGVLGGILEGEINREAGDLNSAIISFKRAVNIEDGMMYDEPEPMPFDSRHWLGAALLEAKRFVEAEHVYRTELEDHPHNGWSLMGCKLALEGQGKTDAEIDADYEQSWARSDTWIQTSRF